MEEVQELNPVSITIEMINGKEFIGHIHIPYGKRLSDHIENLNWLKCFKCFSIEGIKDTPKKFIMLNIKNILCIYET